MIKYLDNIASNVSLKIAKFLVRKRVTPIQVTVFRFLVATPVSWYFFSKGSHIYNIIGLFSYMVLAILDWVDGEMAELYKLPKQTKPFGRLIDHTSDRILMLVVLGAIFYAGMISQNTYIWIPLAVGYYSTFFFLTVSLYEFDKMFGVNFDTYPDIERQMHSTSRKAGLIDKILYNLLYVHNNSVTRICFTHNYLLIIGILTNQLLTVFIFITLMNILRIIGIFLITYMTLKNNSTSSALFEVMRKYKK